MKAYNETWLRNRQIVRQSERWQRRGLLSAEQLGRIRTEHPVGFRQTNGFVEIGLFVFTMVAVSGLFFLLVSLFDPLLNINMLSLATGLIVTVLLHVLLREKHFYRSGIDNALVLVTTGLVAAGLGGLLPDGLPTWAICLATLPILLTSVWYYGDLLVTFAAFAAFCTAVVDFTLELPAGQAILPFVGMAAGGGLYALARHYDNRPGLLYWEDDFTLLEWLALALLILSSNYFVVRTVNFWLLDTRSPEPPEIALGWLFWLLTFLIPAGLLVLGLRKRDRPLLIMSFLGLAGALSALRYYYPLFSLETYVALNGFLLILLAGFIIRFLKTPRHGFTDQPDEESPDDLLFAPETLTVVQSAAPGLSHNTDELRFGEGDFGGGGAGEKY